MQAFMINLTGKKVIVVGGGRIAARKAKVLTEEQPNMMFIAPEFSDEVLEIAQNNGYPLLKREARPTDFREALLVILATNDRSVNQYLAKSIEPRQLVCVVDEASEGNVIFPASVTRGSLQIAVSTGGASPKLTRSLKNQLEKQFDESWEIYTSFLTQCRQLIKGLSLSPEEKNNQLTKLLDDRFRTDAKLREGKLKELNQLKQ